MAYVLHRDEETEKWADRVTGGVRHGRVDMSDQDGKDLSDLTEHQIHSHAIQSIHDAVTELLITYKSTAQISYAVHAISMPLP